MEVIAPQAAGLVDPGRCGRPAGIIEHRVIEHGVVQRRHDALDCVLAGSSRSASVSSCSFSLALCPVPSLFTLPRTSSARTSESRAYP